MALCVMVLVQQILIGSYYYVTLGNPGDTTSRHALGKHPLYWRSRNARGLKPGQPRGGFCAGRHHLTLEYEEAGQRM